MAPGPGEMVLRHPLEEPWIQYGAVSLGLWLMLSPAVFGTGGALADSSHLAGSLVVSLSVVATAEPARALRFLNVPRGAWAVAAPWQFGGAPTVAALNGAAVGVLLVALSVPRGTVRDRYGSWQSYVV